MQHLSLTQTGRIAGTAEYLPPEAYRSGYQPGIKGDIYALGIILHELLTGSPPRGAWRAVSQQRRTDIRVDEALQKALAPDPAQRWSSVAEMSAALAEIERTRPRYSGTPLINPAIRTADAVWTSLGLLILFTLFGVILRLTRADIPWPIDLVGKHTLRTGGYQALFFLLLALAPLAIWQIIRLHRFRAIPLREALPSPFGLRLGHARLAAVLVLGAQLLCLVIPAIMLTAISLDAGNYWLKPGDPAWRRGLLVTKWGSDQLLSPWSWPEKNTRYWLKEYHGIPGDPLARQIDYLEFHPGIEPWTLTAAATTIALALLITCATAIVRWWPHRRARSLTLCATSLAIAVWIFWPEKKAPTLTAEQQQERDNLRRRDDPNLYIVLSDKVIRTLYSDPPPTREDIEKKVMLYYPNEVGFRDRGRIKKREVLELLAAEADEARRANRHATIVSFERFPTGNVNPGTATFRNRMSLLVFCEPPNREASGHWINLEHRAVVAPNESTICILDELHESLHLYWAIPRELPASEATAWARDFVAALTTLPSPGTEDPLTRLLTPSGYMSNDDGRLVLKEARQLNRLEHIALLRASPLWDSSKTRPTLAGPPAPAEHLPGARRRLTFPVLDANGLTEWQADLVFQEGRWQAVTVRF